MDMQRYLLVLDKDLLTVDEELGLEPINYLVARQEQKPCEIVVLSLAVRVSQLWTLFFPIFTGIASAPERLTGTQERLSIERTWPCGTCG
jgi:hypothetical protein